MEQTCMGLLHIFLLFLLVLTPQNEAKGDQSLPSEFLMLLE